MEEYQKEAQMASSTGGGYWRRLNWKTTKRQKDKLSDRESNSDLLRDKQAY